MTEQRKSKFRDFILLTYGVFLGMIGNFLVEYVNTVNPPSPENLPTLIWFMFLLLVFYLVGAFYFLWRLG